MKGVTKAKFSSLKATKIFRSLDVVRRPSSSSYSAYPSQPVPIFTPIRQTRVKTRSNAAIRSIVSSVCCLHTRCTWTLLRIRWPLEPTLLQSKSPYVRDKLPQHIFYNLIRKIWMHLKSSMNKICFPCSSLNYFYCSLLKMCTYNRMKPHCYLHTVLCTHVCILMCADNNNL